MGLGDPVGAELAAIAARPVPASIDEGAPARRSGTATEPPPAEVAKRLEQAGRGVRGNGWQSFAFGRPGSEPPTAVRALELRRRSVLPGELVQEPDGVGLRLRVEHALEPRPQRAYTVDVAGPQPLRGRLETVPVEPVTNVGQPFDQVGLCFELVPGVDEIDGDRHPCAARFVSCQRHNA